MSAPLAPGIPYSVAMNVLGLKSGPGNLQMTFHPTGPARARSLKKSEITFFHVKMTVFTSTVPAHRALPKCKHGQAASGPDQGCSQEKYLRFFNFRGWFTVNQALF